MASTSLLPPRRRRRSSRPRRRSPVVPDGLPLPLLLLLLSLASRALPPPRCAAAFVSPAPFHRRPPSSSSPASSASSASSAATDDAPPPYLFENYSKPVVLLGLSSSPRANELERLAISLSGSLGGGPRRLRESLEQLERSQGAGLLGDDRDDDDAGGDGGERPERRREVAGISLSAAGLDPDGPFVLDADLVRSLIRDKTLGLTSGVVVLDFNHAAFHDDEERQYQAEEYEVDLIRALGAVAKTLYEEEGLMSIYVNVQPSEEGAMDERARERRKSIEGEVLIPFSDYELCLADEGLAEGDGDEQGRGGTFVPAWDDARWELRRIVARALLPAPIPGATDAETPNNGADLLMGENAFFLSLSFPRATDAEPYIEKMCEDVDAMEYRVDLLDAARDYLALDGDEGSAEDSCKEDGEQKDPRFDILYQQQVLRYMCRPHALRSPALPLAGSVVDDALPVVYTVRTAHQAGTWPDDERGIERMFELLELGLRGAAEVLDVESAWDATSTDRLLRRARERHTSLILGSHHVVGTQASEDEAVELYRQCRMNGRAHGAKVVLSIDSNDDGEDRLAYDASLAAAKLDEPEIPHVSLVLGEDGSYSRVLNPRFTPVTHESLPFAAAPGQLTAAEIMAARVVTGLVPARRYAILGHNIAYSVSPQMQGGAFAACRLPHSYTRADVATVEEFVEGPLWNDENFGGCSVTIPHKRSIVPHLDVLTDAAREIGSVNTVIVKKDKRGTRVLIGENTDWRGIRDPLRRRIGDGDGDGSGGCALILGGGGTARAAAYAASKLGLERLYHNRTPEKAADLAAEFGGTVVTSLDEDPDAAGSLGALLAQSGGALKVVISTLPAAAEFTLPSWMLDPTKTGGSLPVVFDVNYKPYNTALLLQATEGGCDIVRGSEMLWEQGAGQFELWTGRSAPYGVMKRAVLENCLPKEEEA